MTRAVPQPDDYDDDEDTAFLGVSYRDDGDVPKLVIVGIVWAAAGIVALIAAVLARNLALAVFGGLSTVAGGGLWIALRARDQLQDGEYVPFADPSAGFVDGDYPDDEPEDDHPTRVMSSGDGADHDDIEDAEYTEYTDYIERVPSEQDDGTGYDDDRVAQERWEQSQRDREAAAAAAERGGSGGPDDDEPADDTADAPTGAVPTEDSDDDRRGSRA